MQIDIIDLNIQNLTILLNKIIDSSRIHRCEIEYSDSFHTLLQANPNFCSPQEKKFIEKILFWYIEFNEINNNYTLKPIFNFTSNQHSPAELLTRYFSDDEIKILIALSNQETLLNSEILARINDILYCYKHTDKKIKNRPFAERAIKHYLNTSTQQHDREDIVTRLIRAIKISAYVRLQNNDLLLAIDNNLNLHPTDEYTLKILMAKYELHNDTKEKTIADINNILTEHLPTLKMNPDSLCNSCDFLIERHNDQSKKDHYQKMKIEFLLAAGDTHNIRGNNILALGYYRQAKIELEKIKISDHKKKELSNQITGKIDETNRLPSNMQQSKISTEILIDPNLEKIKSSPLRDVLKYLFQYIKLINYETILKNGGFFLDIANILSTDPQNRLLHDEKPKSIKYSDRELLKVNYLLNLDLFSGRLAFVAHWNIIFQSPNKNNQFIGENFLDLENYLNTIDLSHRKKTIMSSVKNAILTPVMGFRGGYETASS